MGLGQFDCDTPDMPMRSCLDGSHLLKESMGSSEQVSRILEQAKLVAPTDFMVLLTGETGSGKDLVARSIHRLSCRKDGPFVPVDCGSISENLIENELFGHDRGAFTGADGPRPGKFEIACRGTLFLDEISNLPLSLQPKLLRVLQEKRIWRIGGAESRMVDVRVIAASNQEFPSLIREEKFRRDLYHRLNEFSIRVPPLRERREDIMHLTHRFMMLTNKELNKNILGLSEAASEVVLSYEWPGNVRELRNMIRRAVLMADSVIETEHLGMPESPLTTESWSYDLGEHLDKNLPLKELVRRVVIWVERDALLGALQRTGGNKAKAARLLQIDYKTIHKKIREYSISCK